VKISHKKRSLKRRKKLKLMKKTFQNRKRKPETKIKKENLRRMSRTTNKAKQRKKFWAFS